MATKQQMIEETGTEVSIKDLLEAGVHFGHQTHRWNPKMKRYIFEERNGIHILDLAKTMAHIRAACQVARKIVGNHQSILFVGTKKQAKLVIRECAEDCGEFYVAERWLGGMLTNLTTIRHSVKKLERIEKKISSGGDGLKKKELSHLSKLQEKLERNLSGIRGMRKLPGLLVVVDPAKEHIAVAEARKLNIPVMAVADTNCDPDLIDYVIAGNDDALKSNKILLQAITNAIVDKKRELGLPVTLEEREVHAQEMREKRAQEKRVEEELRAKAAVLAAADEKKKSVAEEKNPAAKKGGAKKSTPAKKHGDKESAKTEASASTKKEEKKDEKKDEADK